MDIEQEKIHHLECLAIRFIQNNYENTQIFLHINNLPDELKIIILSRFIYTQLKKLSHHHINKYELYSMSDPNNRKFTRSFKTTMGRSRAWSELEIISNILLSAYFNETYYDLITVFESQLGFQPSTYYMKELEKIFPTNKLFRVVNVNDVL